jgi:caa(3)-type oxidase subunit IV
MSSASPADAHDVRREQKRYLVVYTVLVAGTALTVAMYYVHFDEPWQTVATALSIAAAKAACVAAVFMHLWHGQRGVYKLLLFTGVFVAAMFALSVFSLFDLPGSGHYVE